MNIIGQKISHYQILEKLGSGGMGSVYKAQDLKLERLVALKFLNRDLISEIEFRQRFINEAKAICALEHPNIAVLYEIDEVGGDHCAEPKGIDERQLRSSFANTNKDTEISD